MFYDNSIVLSFRGPLGVPVEIGQSLALLACAYVFLNFGAPADLIWSAAFLVMLVGSIFLHEMGHAWACEIQGVPVRRIMLYGGGGFCEPKQSATRYQQELIVAMGPIVNLVLWAVSSLAGHWILSGIMDGEVSDLSLTAYPYISMFAQINLWLAIFNLLPVEPLDGGKLFFLMLARILPSRLAARISAGVGLFVAILWIPAAVLFYLSFGWILLFIPSIRANWQALRA